MIDTALYAEKYAGPGYGKAWWDSRGDLYPSGYYPPSRQYRINYRISTELGWSSVLDDNGETISHPPAPSFADHTFLYNGWYTWPYEDAFEFRPGAICWHLQSATASGARTDTVTGGYWCSGLLNRGVAATLGAVNEPYVEGYSKGDLFMQTMLQGYSFGEACFFSFTGSNGCRLSSETRFTAFRRPRLWTALRRSSAILRQQGSLITRTARKI